MTLLLDGQQVRGKSLKVAASLRIESKDLSGQTSNSESAHTGFKAKTLTITCLIRFADADDLRNLMSLAEATGSGGQLKTYRVVNDTAASFGVRQVQFSDGVSAREDDQLSAWRIQFTLTEKLSNPERVEKRRNASAVTQLSGPGQAVGGAAGGTGAGAQSQELTGFEATLKRLDTWLGDSA
ncbi:DNA-binding protein [Pseudomonas sp. SCB32]|uniref:baseplate complex protein n=1 Tax=Pseudomonas sp. SCB32 TaxID=2653853 RepID=UPI0012647724|nr:DNA-binding protein [Pseudomonas sp. SCB32]